MWGNNRIKFLIMIMPYCYQIFTYRYNIRTTVYPANFDLTSKVLILNSINSRVSTIFATKLKI